MLKISQLDAIQDPIAREAIKTLLRGVNTTAEQGGFNPAGVMPAPDAIDRLEVAAADGIVDAKITDNTDKQRLIFYFLEYHTAPDFADAIVYPMGPSRNARIQIGSQSLYFRAYSQYLGSRRSEPVTFGSPPTLVATGGSAGPPPQGSGGSGGGQGGPGEGFGDPPRGDSGEALP